LLDWFKEDLKAIKGELNNLRTCSAEIKHALAGIKGFVRI